MPEPLMLHLASQSPRRRQLLQQLGVDFSVIEVEVPEQRASGESPREYVQRVARDKARAGLASLIADAANGGKPEGNPATSFPRRRESILVCADSKVDSRFRGNDEQRNDYSVVSEVVVLGADTEVVLDGEVFGKPRDADDAAAMLGRLSGRTHEVISALWLVAPDRELAALSVSQVRFAALDAATITAYVATGEPFGKAGGYAIQGGGAALVEHLAGSYSGVMGLPLFETARALREFAR